MKKSTKIMLTAPGGAAVLIAAVVVTVFALLNHQKNADFYTLGEERIPTVKAVVGVRDLTGNLVFLPERRAYQYRRIHADPSEAGGDADRRAPVGGAKTA